MSNDLKELAKEIAATENPYAEFDKHASDLDDTHKTTLSRELNKQLFLKGLSGSDLNNNISFGIIDSGVDHGAVVGTGSNTEKVAADNTTVDKLHLVADDMFLLSRDENKMIKMAAYGSAEENQYASILTDDFEKTASDQSASLSKRRTEEKLRLGRELDNCDYVIIDSIVKTAAHEGELRGALSILASNGREDIIEAVIMSSNYSMDDIANVESDNLDKTAAIYLTEVAIVSSEAIEAVAKITDQNIPEATEKVAMLGSLISKGVKAVGSVAGAIAGVGVKAVVKPTAAIGKKAIPWMAKQTGKGVLGVGKMTGKAALKVGKSIGKKPVKALALAGGTAIGLDMIGKAETNREKIVDGLM